jgi:hypothetical protein
MSNISQEIFKNLLDYQRKDIIKTDSYDKFTMNELKKISNKIDKNIFTSKSCCNFSGKINRNKPVIRFRGKYVNLRRLLYHNYIDNIVKQKKVYTLCKNDQCLNFLHYDIKIT